MNLTISGHHLEVTPALREYVTHKLDRVIRHFDQMVDVKVLLTVEKQKEKEKRQRAECSIHVKGGDLFAEWGIFGDQFCGSHQPVVGFDRWCFGFRERAAAHRWRAACRLEDR